MNDEDASSDERAHLNRLGRLFVGASGKSLGLPNSLEGYCMI